MPAYKAPLRDMQFVINDLLEMEQHYRSLTGCTELSADTLNAIIESGAQFSQEVLAPLNRVGDEQGCHFENGKVTTPDGFKEAFRQFGADGWQSLSVPESEGGQGLPSSVGMIVNEMTGSANWAWSMYTGLANAPITCLLAGGSTEQKATYLPRLLTGEWAGTMCLTEAHCGSDVGLLKTKATLNADGSYSITGTKIFISGGEQDITENIIHAVLARIEGAPKGTKGISLFIVPKFLVNDDGSCGDRNPVNCGAIEKKMGIKGSATCVMNFDGAKGFLLGEENEGLKIMFEMMNQARIGTALQGLSLGEAAYQGSLTYAKERLQMRSLTGAKNPEGGADPIIVHPDVRRMLLTQKAFVEGSRAFLYWLGQLVDETDFGTGDEVSKKEAEDLLGFLTPIAKAFVTETAFESTNHGLQVFGGHGYIADHGMEQIVRDTRISMVYEGTTGIQALDLIGRKVMGSGGELLRVFTKRVHKFCEANKENPALSPMVEKLAEVNREWGELTVSLGEKAMQNADEVGAASVDYLMYSGYVVFAYIWARMALVADQKINAGSQDAFYKAKMLTAKFYFDRLLPRTKAHAAALLSGAENLMTLPESDFAF
ncbi:MAG: acyl-CoA dehydrogenase C-terminal domain-containing protein [Pseudomonadales bacterium]|nr:acyl-CoA dehydrogenase C-terminal domain-containing protein [Pseudomonadales bacterium]